MRPVRSNRAVDSDTLRPFVATCRSPLRCKANFDAREFGFLNKIHETYYIVSKTLHSSI